MSHWTASAISSANYCGMRWWLEYVKKVERARLSVYEKGTVLHELIENFWKKRAKNAITHENAQAFAEHAQGKWMQRVIMSKKSDSPISWRFENEPWVIKKQINKLAPALYDYLIAEGPPLFSELLFDFKFDGIRYKGRIDEIRVRDNQPLVRDYKSGNPRMGNMRRTYDPQPTVYCLAVSALAHARKSFAKELGLEDEASSLMGNPRVISPRIAFEYVMLEDRDNETDKVSISAHRGTRTDANYVELRAMIQGIEARHRANAIYPERGSKCDSCPVKDACVSYAQGIPLNNQPKQQRFFNFSEPPLYDLTINRDEADKQGRLSKVYRAARNRK